MSRFYMKKNKILNGNRQLYATLEKTSERGRYDMRSANGSFICSIFKIEGGFAISSTTNQNDIAIYAVKKHVLQIGIGPRILPKPIIPLANLPFGSYTGMLGDRSLVINRKSIIVDGQTTAQYSGANVGFGNAFLSAYTYLHQHIDISDSVSEINAHLAIYAYLFRLAD